MANTNQMYLNKIWKTMVYGYSDDLVYVGVDFKLWKETDRYTDVRIKFDDGTCIKVVYENDSPAGTRWCIHITKKGTNVGRIIDYKYPLSDVYVTDALPVKMTGHYTEE